ncbi:hypothetical protein KUC_1167 [Vreelandella boliviensis LC1]|uniref:Uncharacterized protein n=1 Tax=Vreelandella boliviensis LC1 TaxID=1072583 RepID=A0A7U9C506_9GAMM|nr:hypothetical protein KUC_1167 [Halomonas boliviensis LC1]
MEKSCYLSSISRLNPFGTTRIGGYTSTSYHPFNHFAETRYEPSPANRRLFKPRQR